MENILVLNLDFNLVEKNMPENIYALRNLDIDKDKTFDIVINHEGSCPEIYSEREQSRFNDYLTNLQDKVVSEFYVFDKLKKPKNYLPKIKLMTNENGDLYHLSRSVKQ